MDGWEFLSGFEPKDYVAFILIPCATLLILTGRDGLIGGILGAIALAYFGISPVKKLLTP